MLAASRSPFLARSPQLGRALADRQVGVRRAAGIRTSPVLEVEVTKVHTPGEHREALA